MTNDRRSFLRGALGGVAAGAALNLLPATVRKAMAIPANNASGTIMDVEHVVIFMQENRAFDHYFGTLNGVRGFDVEKLYEAMVKNATTSSSSHTKRPGRSPLMMALKTEGIPRD